MILSSYLLALGQIGDPAFRRVLGRGVALALGLLLAASAGVVALVAWLVPNTVAIPWIDRTAPLGALLTWAAVPVVLALSVVLMVPVASAMTSLFLDEVAEAVEARHYPALPPARAQPWSEAARDAASSFGVVFLANVLALGLSLVAAPLAPLIWLGLNGWLLGRESFRVAALRRLPPDAVAALARRHRGRIWALGAVAALPLAVPVVNLVAPTLAAAAFAHLFQRLARG